MDLLQWIDAKLGRWLAYADTCVNAETELPRCQGFWNFLGIVLAVICVAAVAGALLKVFLARRKALQGRSSRRYGKPG
jgi:hypothetical protein